MLLRTYEKYFTEKGKKAGGTNVKNKHRTMI